MKKIRLLSFIITLFMTVGAGIMPAHAAHIAAGGAHTIALKQDGTLWAWGWNEYGQLGIGSADLDAHPTPVQVGTNNTWTAVAAGWAHTMALKADGTLWAWGWNSAGQLGNGSADGNLSIVAHPTPIQIVIAINTKKWTAVATGGEHTIALKEDGTLWAWGLNASGQLGNGTRDNQLQPVQIAGTTWTSVAAGGDHTIVLKDDGTLWAWGLNAYGQLGDGTTDDQLKPVQIAGTTWTNVTAGGAHTIALKTDGTLWAWGWNEYGQLGDGTTDDQLKPVQIAGTTWTNVTAGGAHTIARMANGTLWAWGWNSAGQLGNGSADGDLSIVAHPTPVKIGAASNWTNMTTGYAHSIALKTDKTLWAWGWNGDGQLGDTTTTSQYVPVKIMKLYTFPWPMFLPAITRGIR
jgi:alpha-tubulin suppressor-like RCC1 family protein